MIWLFLACAKVPTLDLEAPDWPSVGWTPDGRVLVDGKLVLDPDTREVTGLAGRWPTFSPSGRRIAWEDLGLFHWGEVGGVSHIIDMERWLDGEATDPPRLIVGWLDDDRLYVHQSDPYLVYETQIRDVIAEACRVYDVRDRSWTEPEACASGDMSEIHATDPRGDLMIVGSHGEGHPALDVIAWTPDRVGAVGFPLLDLYPFGPVDATHRGAGVIDLLTPCRLDEGDRPCQRPDGEDRTEEPWRHYRWRRGGQLELVRADLPVFAVVDPTGDRYAWPTVDAVCVGDPARRATTTCFPVR